MPNITINHQVNYIRTNFFFEIIHKKEKTFGPDGLLRSKWYPKNSPPDRFKDGLDNKRNDIPILLEKDQEEIPLELEEIQLENGRGGYILVRHSSYLKVEVHRVGLDMHRVQKLHAMSSVMWTCQNNLGLNLCVVPPTSHVVAISENSLVRSYKERSKVHCH